MNMRVEVGQTSRNLRVWVGTMLAAALSASPVWSQTVVSASARATQGGTARALATGSQGAVVQSHAQAGFGGVAQARAEGRGRVNLSSTAAATQGLAVSQLRGDGRFGGQVLGTSDALTHGGEAISRVDLAARGPGALVVGNGTAASEFGVAHTNVVGQARGRAFTEVNGTALGRPGGFARTDVRGRAVGLRSGRTGAGRHLRRRSWRGDDSGLRA